MDGSTLLVVTNRCAYLFGCTLRACEKLVQSLVCISYSWCGVVVGMLYGSMMLVCWTARSDEEDTENDERVALHLRM